MANGDDLRRLALALEGVSEAPHFDRLAFRCARTFATLAPDRLTANIRLTPEEQEFRCLVAPNAFQALRNAWGRQGWTAAVLAELEVAELDHVMRIAWAHARPKRRRGPRSG